MNPLHLPWLELMIGLAIFGAIWVSRIRTPGIAFRWGLGFMSGIFGCAFLAWLSFAAGVTAAEREPFSVQPYLFGPDRELLALDVVSAPLVPAVALLHLLTALATARTKMRRFSLSWSLTKAATCLAAFSCKEPWLLVGLLTAGTILPCIELLNRRRPMRVYVVHMAVFVTLLILGSAFMQTSDEAMTAPALATVPLMAAILVRCGTVPAHCWVTDWFEHASFGNALLFVAPLTGVYVAIRLVLPIAPDWVLRSIGIFSLVTAVYAAGMAVVQRETRRFFGYLFLSHGSLVLVGLELHTRLSLTGALSLWFAVILSLGGFGITLRALEARFGRLALTDFHGLYDHSPALAVCFMLTGLASVGFPGTIGFVSTDLLVDGAVGANVLVGVGVVAASALNGIAVVRAYFLLFTGKRHASSVDLSIGVREHLAVLTLTALVLCGGVFPQPGILSRHAAAEEILRERMRVATASASESAPTEGENGVVAQIIVR
jgi:NADH-quinone oxidoreductase subunit M